MKKQHNLLKMFMKTTWVFMVAGLSLSSVALNAMGTVAREHNEHKSMAHIKRLESPAKPTDKGDLPINWGNGALKFSKPGRGALLFRLAEQKGKRHDIEIVFGKTVGDNAYRIILGGGGNIQTEIRNSKGQAQPIAQDLGFLEVSGAYSAGRIGSPNNPHAWYWALVDSNTGYVAVGQGPMIGQNLSHAIKVDAKDLAQINYVGLTSWNDAITYEDVSIIPLESYDSAVAFSTNGQQHEFLDRWKFPVAGNGILTFSALAEEEISIAFAANKKSDINSGHRIVIGAENNTRSYIMKNGKEVAQVAKGIFRPGQLSKYWISFNAQEKTVSVGFGGFPRKENTLVSFTDLQYDAAMQYFSFGSGKGLTVNYENIRVHKQSRSANANSMNGMVSAARQTSATGDANGMLSVIMDPPAQAATAPLVRVVPTTQAVPAVTTPAATTTVKAAAATKASKEKKNKKNKKSKVGKISKKKKNKKHKKNKKAKAANAVAPVAATTVTAVAKK